MVIYHYWFLIVDPNKSTDFLARCMATFSHVVLFFSVNRGIEHDYLTLFLTRENGTGSHGDLWSSGKITQAVSLSLQNSESQAMSG